jgi:hypothetical protein
VEYELDTDDEAWLDGFNAELAAQVRVRVRARVRVRTRVRVRASTPSSPRRF